MAIIRRMKARGLHELKRLHQAGQARIAAAEALRRAELEAERQAQRERHLFSHAMGQVQPLTTAPRAIKPTGIYPVLPRQRQRDEQQVLREAISDDFDVETLIETDESLSFRQRGVGMDVVRKLRRGHWTLHGQIDLHGLRSDEAREHLSAFIQTARKQGWRCVRVVHGKGLGSPGKTPVLKDKSLRWLAQRQDVIAFVQARACDGGAGALMVLLRP